MADGDLQVGILTSGRSNVADGPAPGANPLGWALRSLAAQDVEIRRVHVLKHGPDSPGFRAVIAAAAEDLPISVEHYSAATEVAVMRNHLLDVAGSDLLYILDDDAVLADPSALGRQWRAWSPVSGTVAIQGPVLRRTLRPRPVVTGRPVAHIDPARGRITHRFDTAGPAAAEPVGTFQIDHLCLAQTLLDPAAARAVGGFAAFPWPALYGQESELAVRLARAGGTLLFLPDPRAAIVHLKFGAPFWPEVTPEVVETNRPRVLPGGTPFAMAAAAAANPTPGDRSWSRRPSAGFYADYVSGFGAVFAQYGGEALHTFLAGVARRFVVSDEIRHPFVPPLIGADQRRRAYGEGLKRLVAAGLLTAEATAALLVESRRHLLAADGLTHGRSSPGPADPQEGDLEWI